MTGIKTKSTERPDPYSHKGKIALARMLLKIFDLWGLQVKDQLSLLGLHSKSRARLTRYLEGEAFANQRDLLDRARNLLSIQDSLRILYPDNQEVACKWMTTPNLHFEGVRPADVVQKEGFYGLWTVKRYLENEIRGPFDVKKILRQAKLRKKKTYDITKVLKIKHEATDFFFDSIIRKGFPFYMARRVQSLLDIPDKDFARILGIGISAFRRLKINKGKLSHISNDQLYRLAALFAFAVDVLGSEEYAKRWFTSRLIPLGGRTPLELAETDLGGREVENLLNSIRYGTCL
ncbi:MAG: DUF2384 domain-containing protein [Nitrospiraceae bacterium]|nr:DUF2384 domain-containing protein [Nitrospiraceae bacterium]